MAKHKIQQDGLLGNEMILETQFPEKSTGKISFGPEMEFFTVKKINGIWAPIDIIGSFKKSPYFEDPKKEASNGKHLKIKPELTGEQIELDAGPETSLAAIEANLNALLNEALSIAESAGAKLMPAALYPLKHEFSIYNLPRYHFLTKTIGPDMRRNAPRVTSDQINVGGYEEAEAFQVFNFLRKALPFYTGFAVASPFVNGEQGEDLDERIRVYNNTLLRYPELAGFPEELHSMEDYIKLLEEVPIIQHPNINYKLIRPMPQRGVAGEIRSIDKQPTVEEYMAFVALTKGLLQNMEGFKAPKFVVRDFYKAVKDGIYDKDKFREVLAVARKGLTVEEKDYLKPLERRLEKGTVAEKLVRLVQDGATVSEAYGTLCNAAESGKAYI